MQKPGEKIRASDPTASVLRINSLLSKNVSTSSARGAVFKQGLADAVQRAQHPARGQARLDTQALASAQPRGLDRRGS